MRTHLGFLGLLLLQYLKFIDRRMQITTQIVAFLAISTLALKKLTSTLTAILVLFEKFVIH